MKITILGCSCSIGVPVIGCKCAVCLSGEEKNKRSRSSVFIELNNGKNILIDVTPDFRYQAMRNNLGPIDVIILTHFHNDHVNGLNDLIYINKIYNKIPIIYSNKSTLDEIRMRYNFINWVSQPLDVENLFGTNLFYKEVNNYEKINLDDQLIKLFEQDHGDIYSLGIRINNFVYSTDVNEFPEKSEEFLENIDIWILDCLNFDGTKKHLGWNKILKLKNKFSPKNIYLTHMSHKWDYYHLLNKGKELNIQPCYDNMSLVI